MRSLRPGVIAVALLVAAPAIAQSFEGLDLTEPKKHRSKKGKKKHGKESPSKPDEAEAPPEQPAAAVPEQPAAQAPAAPAAPVAPAPAATQPADTSGGFGLDLTQEPLPKKGKEDKKSSAPTMTFDAVDVSGKSADRQKIDVVANQFKDNQYEPAALSAFELMNDPKSAELSVEAQYILAKSLYRLGMYHSSLLQFSKILARGPDTKFFKNSLEWLFFISHKTTNETVILDEIAKYSNFEFPEKFRSEFHYLLARYHFVRGRALDRAEQKGEADRSFAEVKRIVLMIPRDDPFYPKAKYLEALALFRDENFSTGLESLKEVIRQTRPGGDKDAARVAADQKLRELTFMQLARTHYGHRQNRNAITYYSKIERGSPHWLPSLFEASWANYRVGQYEQALGNLITLSSPFFRDEYFPEALILKAVIYYENCRYRESTMILEDFEHIYNPVLEELTAITSKEQDASEYYNVLAEVQKKPKGSANSTDAILERILKLALTDQDLKKVNDSILELEAELDAYGQKGDTFRYSELSKTMMEELKAQRAELIKKAGIMAKGKLELENLKRLLGDALRIRFETTNREKEFLEAQLQAGGGTAIVKDYKISAAVADDELYWPYEGEYWRDELGTYQYTLTKGCVNRDAANVKVSARGGE